jgi:hypothetical protein
LTSNHLVSRYELERLDTSISSGMPAFLTLVFRVLADVWRRGVALLTEQEPTIRRR